MAHGTHGESLETLRFDRNPGHFPGDMHAYDCVLIVRMVKLKVLPNSFCSTSWPQNSLFSSISWFSISNNPSTHAVFFMHMNPDFGIISPVVGFVSTISSAPCWHAVKTSADGSGFSVSTYLEKSWCGALMQPLIETEYLSSASRCRWVSITVWCFLVGDDGISCICSLSNANPSSAFSPGAYTRIRYVIMSITLNCDPSRILQCTRGCAYIDNGKHYRYFWHARSLVKNWKILKKTPRSRSKNSEKNFPVKIKKLWKKTLKIPKPTCRGAIATCIDSNENTEFVYAARALLVRARQYYPKTSCTHNRRLIWYWARKKSLIVPSITTTHAA